MGQQSEQNNLYRAHGETRPGGDAHATTLAATIPFDGSSSMGPDIPGPAHLVASALAACVLKNVERFSQMLPFEYSAATVNVTLERENSPPRIVSATYVLNVSTDESAPRCKLLHKNIRKYGTISNTLALACELGGSMQATRTNGDVEEIEDTSRPQE